jgi:hypothetical protein
VPAASKAIRPPSNGKIELTEYEQQDVRGREDALVKLKVGIADLALQIASGEAQLANLRAQQGKVMAAWQTKQEELRQRIRHIVSSRGHDLDAPDAGRWNVDLESMTIQKVDG